MTKREEKDDRNITYEGVKHSTLDHDNHTLSLEAGEYPLLVITLLDPSKGAEDGNVRVRVNRLLTEQLDHSERERLLDSIRDIMDSAEHIDHPSRRQGQGKDKKEHYDA
jgi:hypothetical protein